MESKRKDAVDVVLTGVESAHVATMLVIGMETIRMTALEMLMHGDVEGSKAGMKIAEEIRNVLNTFGARQQGKEASFNIPEGAELGWSDEVSLTGEPVEPASLSGLVGGNLI